MDSASVRWRTRQFAPSFKFVPAHRSPMQRRLLDRACALARHGAGAAVVLVRRDTETSDIAVLESAVGLLTQRGARTPHAAVVARQFGKVCLIRCADWRCSGRAVQEQVLLHVPEREDLKKFCSPLHRGRVRLARARRQRAPAPSAAGRTPRQTGLTRCATAGIARASCAGQGHR